MYNWFVPITDWYNESTAKVSYVEVESSAIDAVVEIGLIDWTYHIKHESLRIHVLAKVIDPVSKKVLGRSRDFTGWPVKVGPIEKLLANDAAKLKKAFGEISKELVASCLKDLGLVLQ